MLNVQVYLNVFEDSYNKKSNSYCLMDYDDSTEQDESAASTSANSYDDSNIGTRGQTNDNYLGDHIGLEAQKFGCQTKGFRDWHLLPPSLEAQIIGSQTREFLESLLSPPSPEAETFESQTRGFEDQDFPFSIPCPITTQAYITNIMTNEGDCTLCETADEPICHVKLDSLVKLKDSTRKLLCLLEELQSKTHSKMLLTDEPPKLTSVLKPLAESKDEKRAKPLSVTEGIGANAMRILENQTRELGSIVVIEEDDDCSVYKRLTRKCHCLNQREYNDFIIHFNEETKFCTNTIGEIIKNMRILKKFLYMGGVYTKNALMFLNEGLSEASSQTEKLEMIQAIAFADVCNVFDQYTIVTICISWPCKNENFADPLAQGLTAGLLYKIAKMDEGRRYLNLNSKIICDLKKVIKKKSAKIECETIDCLQSVLDLCQPPLNEQPNMTYYCPPLEEDIGNRTLNALVAFRQYMSFDEVFLYLDKLHTMSNTDKGKQELTSQLPIMLNLFKNMLLEYDDSGMNIIITNILNRVVAKNMIKEPDDGPKTQKLIDRATEPIPKSVKNAVIQLPMKKSPKKNNYNKSNLTLGTAPNKHRLASKCKVKDRLEESVQQLKALSLTVNTRAINRSRKFTRDNRNPTIVVPLDDRK